MKRLRNNWLELAKHKLAGKLKPCPCCEVDEHKIDSVVKMPQLVQGAMVGEGLPTTHMLVLICSGCGHVILFSAESLDLLTNF